VLVLICIVADPSLPGKDRQVLGDYRQGPCLAQGDHLERVQGPPEVPIAEDRQIGKHLRGGGYPKAAKPALLVCKGEGKDPGDGLG